MSCGCVGIEALCSNKLFAQGETSAQPTARPNFESAMGASALAQIGFSTQPSTARDGCAEVSVMMLRAWYMQLKSGVTVAVFNL